MEQSKEIICPKCSEACRINFKDYYIDDLSLKEIAENGHVSRNAIYKIVKKVEEKLDYYE